MKILKEIYSIFAVLFFFIGLVLYRFQNIFKPGLTVANPDGDGIGILGLVYELINQFKQIGFVWTDSYIPTDLGGGFIVEGVLASQLWRIIYGVLGLYFETNDVYDLVAAGSLLVTALAAYFTARMAKFSPLWAFIASVCIALLEHYFLRIDAHQSLGFYAFPILTIGFTLWVGYKLSLARLMMLVLSLCLTFVSNEYYGYFSLWMSGAILVGMSLSPAITTGFNVKGFSLRQYKKICLYVFISGSIFILSMSFLYPNLIGSKFTGLYNRITHKESVVNKDNSELKLTIANKANAFDHPYNEFAWYANSNPFIIFKPISKPFGGVSKLFPKSKPEFTFRLGFGFLLMIIYLLWLYKRKSGYFCHIKRLIKHEPHVFGLIFAIIVAIFLALPIHNSLSLAQITYIIAPMFRVSMRIYLFIDVFLILLTLNVCMNLYKSLTIPKQQKHFLMFFLALTIFDLINVPQLLKPQKLFEYPQKAIDHELAKFPQGVLLNLPLKYPDHDWDSDHYKYVAARMINHKPIFEGISFKNHGHILDYMGIDLDINNPSYDLLLNLNNCGIRYIIWHDPETLPDSLLTSPNTHLIADTKDGYLFEFWEVKEYNRNCMAKLITPE